MKDLYVVTDEGLSVVIDGTLCRTIPDVVKVAACESYIAYFKRIDGTLTVFSPLTSTTLMEFKSNIKSPPSLLKWCGSDAVLIYWDEVLLLVGPFGDWLKFTYYDLKIFSTKDGAYLQSSGRTEYLERVSECTEEIFQIGSTKPGALLYDAYDHFMRKDPKADEILRSITNITEAIDSCLDASTFEFDIQVQKSLLKAASLGNTFINNTNPKSAEKFLMCCKYLRVLNAIRTDETIPIFLTFSEYIYTV